MSANKALKVGLGLLAGGLAGYAVYKGIEIGFRDEEEVAMGEQQPSLSPDQVAAINAVKAAQKPKEESKGSIIRKGLTSAANTCTLVTGAAQCVSGIAENISRMAGMFENPGAIGQQPYQYFPQQQWGQQPYNPVFLGNGQVWNRINPLVVSPGFGGGIGVNNPGGYTI